MNMLVDEYQEKAMSTAVYPKEARFVYTALGMAGEAGEVCALILDELKEAAKQIELSDLEKELVKVLKKVREASKEAEALKKDIRKKRGLATEKNLECLQSIMEQISPETQRMLIDETGDVAWYVANMASDINVSLSSVCLLNNKKLADRQAKNEISERKS